MRPISAALFLSVLSLPLFAAITGTVITSEGVPVAGARVLIHALETPYARRTRLVSRTPDAVPLASAQTDEKGTFSLASPKDPVIDLRVEMRGYEPFVRRVERDADAVAIALRKIDMVKGSVTAGGKPVANALVVLGTGYVTRSDEEGHYEAPAINPPYVLAVIHPDYAMDEALIGTGTVPERELIRTLSAGVTLTGRAVAADGASPVAGAEIRVDDWPLAVSGKDGAFTIAHAPTRWTAITAREGTLTGRHTAGGAKTIIVRLEPSAVLSGRVRDAKTSAPIAGAMVEVSRTSVPGMVWAAGVTDASGAYSILVPHDGFGFSIEHPAYATRGDSIRIAPGQQKTQDVVLTQLARVSGVVLDEATNRPVAAARVSTRNARDQGMMDMPPYYGDAATPVTSGPDGKFDVRVVPGHSFYLHFAKTGLPQGRSEDMKLDAGGLKSAVVLTIPAGVAVTGRALDASGKPLSGVSVVAGPGVAPGGVETLNTLLGPVVRVPVLSAGDGTFAMRLKEGTYNRDVHVLDGKTGTDLVVELDTGVRLTGTVTDANGAPLSGVSIIINPSPSGGVIGGLIGGMGSRKPPPYRATNKDETTVTDANGRYTLSGLVPGEESVHFLHPGHVVATRKVTLEGRETKLDVQLSAVPR